MVTFGWILYGALISARMMMSGYPWWEVALWLITGLLLAAFAWDRENRNKKGYDDQLARMERNQTFQSGQMDTLIRLYAEDRRISTAEATAQLWDAVRESFSLGSELRDENRQLRERIAFLKEHPERVGEPTVIQGPPPESARVRDFAAALRSISGVAGYLTVKKPSGEER